MTYQSGWPHVTELTPLLREGPDGDQLASWPASVRVFARRERPHPGAQLSLFETADGWRYSLWATNLPTIQAGWRNNPAYVDAAHRVHARVEDRIRTGRDCGICHFPSESFAINTAWLAVSIIAATLLAWLRHLALDADLAKAEPKTLRYRILHTAARLAGGGRRRRVRIAASWPWASDIATAWTRITASTADSTAVIVDDRSTTESPDDPLTMKIQLVVVEGLAAEALLKRQATVVREVLQWFADNPERDSA